MTKNKSKPIALLLAGLLCTGLVQAQESVNVSGGDASGSGSTVSYSIGQMVYTTNTDASGTVSRGVQQAYEIFTLGINETRRNISFSVFPNPTADRLTMQINDYENEKLSYQLFDMQGKLLSNKHIVTQQTQIDMNSLPTATYLIKVVNQENKNLQSFKVIKN